MKHKAPLLGLLLLLSACQPIMLTLYGIKEPKVENEKSILKHAEKYAFDTANIVTVNSKDFLPVLSKGGIPNAGVYDRHGKYIEYRQTDTSCNAGLFQFIPDLNLNTVYRQPDSANLKTELGKFRDLKGQMLRQPDSADFYLLIYYTSWSGRLNKDHVKIWEDQARNNTKAQIKVYKVNLDFQEYWEAEEREKIVASLSKKKK